MKKPSKSWVTVALLAFASLGFYVTPAFSHHSFAMYDQTKVLVWTGVTTEYVAQAAHSELHFYLIGPNGKLVKDQNGKLVDYGVELAGAAGVFKEGISPDTFPAGTIFSVKVNPLRNGSPFGSRAGNTAIAKCPPKTPPAPGKTCDTVKGSILLGGKGTF